jgi:hypothetical protein
MSENPFASLREDGTCGRSFRSGSGRYYDCGRAAEHKGRHSPFPDPAPAAVADNAGEEMSDEELLDLQADLDKLERTDPDVAAAAESYDRMVERITGRTLLPRPDVSPGGQDTGQGEELREAIVDVLRLYGIRGEKLGSLRPGSVADALLAGPLAPLLAAQEAVGRVERIAAYLDSGNAGSPGLGVIARQLRRVLGGER